MANIIEEMPIEESELANAANRLATFLDHVDTDGKLYGQVRFIFSSINPISASSGKLKSKTSEKIQFLPVETWSNFDISRLVQLLSPTINFALSPEEMNYIATRSNGSPRFVKMVFRHWRNGTSEGASIETLCSRVGKELVS
jgi:hypothetical protein